VHQTAIFIPFEYPPFGAQFDSARIKSADKTVGHQYFSMCWITSSVPAAWLT